jgi:hypothetical protein
MAAFSIPKIKNIKEETPMARKRKPQSRGRPSSIPDKITIDKDGTPLCMEGYRMVNWGISSDRKDRKWRCALKCGKVNECSCQNYCSTYWERWEVLKTLDFSILPFFALKNLAIMNTFIKYKIAETEIICSAILFEFMINLA